MAKRQKNYDYISPIEESTIKRAEKREGTRSTIALVFVAAYFGVIVGLIILTTFFNLPSDVAKDYLLAIGSSLGFILGYYFKSGTSRG